VDAKPLPLPKAGSNRQRLQPAGNHRILTRDLGAELLSLHPRMVTFSARSTSLVTVIVLLIRVCQFVAQTLVW